MTPSSVTGGNLAARRMVSDRDHQRTLPAFVADSAGMDAADRRPYAEG